MALSRLRLRIGAHFALAYLVGLLLLDLALYATLRLQGESRLTRDLEQRSGELMSAVELEYGEHPEAGIEAAGREALREWQGPPGAYAVLDSAARPIAERGAPAWLEASRWDGTTTGTRDLRLGKEQPVRQVVRLHAAEPRFSVMAMASSHGVEEANEALALWLGLSAVFVLLLGVGGGYFLSSRALAPIRELEDAIAGISPAALRERLPVNTPEDEVDRVRVRFNALLDRLEVAQAENRRFLREAAHQIRTPLTLVMGEASLELSRGEGPATEVLRRIQLAAEQMGRRVDDLFLLAEARAGARPEVDEVVELDGLLLEVADAMRGRVHQAGHTLVLGVVEPVQCRGNRWLLREALMELVENAVRHGAPASEIEMSLEQAERAQLTVRSHGAAFTVGEDAVDPRPEHGLGLQIVRWIAGLHGGQLGARHAGGINIVTLVLPS